MRTSLFDIFWLGGEQARGVRLEAGAGWRGEAGGKQPGRLAGGNRGG